MAKQDDLLSFTKEQLAEINKMVQAEAAKLTAVAVKEAEVKALPPEEQLRRARDEEVELKAMEYGDRVMDALFHVSDGSTERDFAITDEGLRQLCYKSCQGAADGWHYSRNMVRVLKKKLAGLQEEAQVGPRSWDVARTNDGRTPQHGGSFAVDEQVTEFEPDDRSVERSIRFHRSRMAELEVLGTMFEYLDDQCFRMKCKKNEEARAEGQNIPEPSRGWAAKFDISPRAHTAYLEYKQKRKQAQRSTAEQAVEAETDLELSTSPLFIPQDETV